MSDEQLPDLHVAAILSWYYWCPEARADSERTEAERRERVERFRSALVCIFGGKYDFRITVNGGCIETEIEGLRLLAYEVTPSQKTETRTMVTLLGRCPSCGVEAMSETFIDLSGLGKQLERFEPIYDHFCLSRRRSATEK
jgi:hypothetical protein